MVAPRTASQGAIGTSAVRSSPDTVKIGCGFIFSLTYKSPTWLVAGWPCLTILITESSLAAVGIFTSIDFGLSTLSVPRHVVQTTPELVPFPLQVGQMRLPCSVIR